MKIIYNNIIPPKGYKAVTVLNCIFARKGTEMYAIDIQHEAIHWAQEKELLIIGFYLLYLIELLVRLALTRNWHKAYREISFEREAYENELNARYLDSRKHYCWTKYF